MTNVRIQISALYIPYVVIVLLWPRYLFFPLGGVGVSPFSLFALLMLALSLYLAASNRDKAVIATNGLASYLKWLAVTLALWLLLCDLLGEYPALSLPATGRNFIYMYSAMIVGSQIFRNASFRQNFALVLSVCLLISGGIGIYERLGSSSFVASLPISRFATSSDQVGIITQGFFREGRFRASSVFIHPIVFGQFVAACLPFGMSLLLQRGRLRKLIGALAVLAMLGGIWASNTRSPYFVATVSVSVFIFLVYFSKLTLARVQVAVLALPALIVVFMANENFYSSLIQGRTKVEMGSSAVRDSMLQTGLAVAQGSPILGFGDGRSPFKAGMVGMNGVLTIDNGYLSWVLDFGYVGFTLFFLVAGLAMLVGVRSTSDKRPPGDNLLLKCAVSYIAGALVGLYVISIYDNLIVGSLLIGAIYSARKWGVNGRRGKAPAQRRPYISMHSSRPRHSLG